MIGFSPFWADLKRQKLRELQGLVAASLMDRETVELAVHNSLGLQTGARSARKDQIIMGKVLPKQSQGLFVSPPSLYLV